jgi:hypothetical protein
LAPGVGQGADAGKKKQNFFNFMGSSRASGKSISNPKRISQRRKAIKDNDFEQRKIQALYGYRASIKIFSDVFKLDKSQSRKKSQMDNKLSSSEN